MAAATGPPWRDTARQEGQKGAEKIFHLDSGCPTPRRRMECRMKKEECRMKKDSNAVQPVGDEVTSRSGGIHRALLTSALHGAGFPACGFRRLSSCLLIGCLPVISGYSGMLAGYIRIFAMRKWLISRLIPANTAYFRLFPLIKKIIFQPQMNAKGKIARLPRKIRDQLNRLVGANVRRRSHGQIKSSRAEAQNA